MKKLFLLAIVAFFFILLAIVAIPSFVKIDQFRPQIVEAIEDNTQLKAELGPLRLSVFPNIKIQAEKLTLKTPQKNSQHQLLGTENFQLSIPLLGLIFSPKLSINLQEAEIHILKEKNSSSTDYLKGTSASPSTPEKVEKNAEEKDSLPTFLRQRIEKAKINLNIQNSKLRYSHPDRGQDYRFEKLELSLMGLGMNSKIETSIKALSTLEKEGLLVKGPVVANGQIRSEQKKDTFQMDVDLFFDFENLFIQSGDSLEKMAGVPLSLNVEGLVKDNKRLDIDFPKIEAQFSETKLRGYFKAQDFNGKQAQIDTKLSSENASLESLADFVKSIKNNALKGKLSLDLNAKGALKDPLLDLDLKLQDVSGKIESSLAKIHKINAHATLKGLASDPSVSLRPLEILIDNSKLSLALKGKGLKKAQYDIKIASEFFNLDSTFLGKEDIGKSTKGQSAKKAKAQPLDQALNEAAPTVEKFLENSFFDEALIQFQIDIDELVALGARYKKIEAQSSLKRRQLKIEKVSLSAYEGHLKAHGDLKLDPKALSFQIHSEIDSIKIQEATKVHAPAWEKELGGTLNGKASIGGKGLRKTQLDKNLSGQFNVVIVDGFSSIPLSKILGDAMKKLPQKVAADASKDQIEGRFKSLNTDGNIAGRDIHLKNLYVHFEPLEKRYGDFKFKGKGKVSFERKIDLQGVAYLDPKKIKWPEAVGSSGDVEIPLRFKGAMDAPQPDLNHTLKLMGDRVLKKTLQKEVKKNEKKLLQEGEKVLKKLFNF